MIESKLWIRNKYGDLNARDCMLKLMTHLSTPCWKTVLHVLLKLLYLSHAETPTHHCLDYLVKNIGLANSLPPQHRPNLLRALKSMIVSPCHAKAGVPFSIIKDVGSLNSGFLSCNATHFVSMSPGLLHINMCVNCGLEIRSTKGWYYGYCYFESTVLNFCHHPWAMSGEPTDRIKISDSSQF